MDPTEEDIFWLTQWPERREWHETLSQIRNLKEVNHADTR